MGWAKHKFREKKEDMTNVPKDLARKHTRRYFYLYLKYDSGTIITY